ncbi:hypothetical protein MXD63_14420 [Frankia sp. Cpl3]|nr:hypothetical protein [Frankia sp. Cpl3]
MPSIPTPGPGEILIEVFDPEPDLLGRVGFFAYWNGTRPGRGVDIPCVRAQVFHMRLDEFAARAAVNHAADGPVTVRVLGGPQALAA